jgi:dTDP-4-dehydrorhamnose 3,5-epimerase-like enzyme
MCCIRGKIKLVMVDIREDSKTKNKLMEVEMGEGAFSIVTIPKGVLHAFKSLKGESVIINCIDHEYNKKNPDEIRVDNVYYDWDKGEKK